MDLARKLEAHYYLKDASHSMNAFALNRCEAEFLAVAAEVANILGVQIDWEAAALAEGGIKEVWVGMGKHSAQIALVISTLALIWSIVPKTDRELVELQKEESRLSIEEKQLSIEKLKRELEENALSDESVAEAARIASDNYKVVTRRSNFYRTLAGDEKIEKVGFSTIDQADRHLGLERIVEKELFPKFFITSNELESIRVESARIDIVAPVLIEGKAKWKGIYEGEYITFAMDDSAFKRSVTSREVSFKNGSAITCVLLIHKKVDELGDIVTTGYSVEVVLDTFESGIAEETPQGKRYRHTKKSVESQNDMFE